VSDRELLIRTVAAIERLLQEFARVDQRLVHLDWRIARVEHHLPDAPPTTARPEKIGRFTLVDKRVPLEEQLLGQPLVERAPEQGHREPPAHQARDER
jgi:hypothetical protein